MPIYFGKKIREARKAAGLTQRELATKINVSNTSISNWEKDLSRPDPDTIQHLCWALNVQPNYFFAIEVSEKPLINDDEELTEYIQMLKTRPECRMLFQLSKNATKEDVEKAVRIIEALRGE